MTWREWHDCLGLRELRRILPIYKEEAVKNPKARGLIDDVERRLSQPPKR